MTRNPRKLSRKAPPSQQPSQQQPSQQQHASTTSQATSGETAPGAVATAGTSSVPKSPAWLNQINLKRILGRRRNQTAALDDSKIEQILVSVSNGPTSQMVSRGEWHAYFLDFLEKQISKGLDESICWILRRQAFESVRESFDKIDKAYEAHVQEDEDQRKQHEKKQDEKKQEKKNKKLRYRKKAATATNNADELNNLSEENIDDEIRIDMETELVGEEDDVVGILDSDVASLPASKETPQNPAETTNGHSASLKPPLAAGNTSSVLPPNGVRIHAVQQLPSSGRGHTRTLPAWMNAQNGLTGASETSQRVESLKRRREDAAVEGEPGKRAAIEPDTRNAVPHDTQLKPRDSIPAFNGTASTSNTQLLSSASWTSQKTTNAVTTADTRKTSSNWGSGPASNEPATPEKNTAGTTFTNAHRTPSSSWGRASQATSSWDSQRPCSSLAANALPASDTAKSLRPASSWNSSNKSSHSATNTSRNDPESSSRSITSDTTVRASGGRFGRRPSFSWNSSPAAITSRNDAGNLSHPTSNDTAMPAPDGGFSRHPSSSWNSSSATNTSRNDETQLSANSANNTHVMSAPNTSGLPTSSWGQGRLGRSMSSGNFQATERNRSSSRDRETTERDQSMQASRSPSRDRGGNARSGSLPASPKNVRNTVGESLPGNLPDHTDPHFERRGRFASSHGSSIDRDRMPSWRDSRSSSCDRSIDRNRRSTSSDRDRPSRSPSRSFDQSRRSDSQEHHNSRWRDSRSSSCDQDIDRNRRSLSRERDRPSMSSTHNFDRSRRGDQGVSSLRHPSVTGRSCSPGPDEPIIQNNRKNPPEQRNNTVSQNQVGEGENVPLAGSNNNPSATNTNRQIPRVAPPFSALATINPDITTDKNALRLREAHGLAVGDREQSTPSYAELEDLKAVNQLQFLKLIGESLDHAPKHFQSVIKKLKGQDGSILSNLPREKQKFLNFCHQNKKDPTAKMASEFWDWFNAKFSVELQSLQNASLDPMQESLESSRDAVSGGQPKTTNAPNSIPSIKDKNISSVRGNYDALKQTTRRLQVVFVEEDTNNPYACFYGKNFPNGRGKMTVGITQSKVSFENFVETYKRVKHWEPFWDLQWVAQMAVTSTTSSPHKAAATAAQLEVWLGSPEWTRNAKAALQQIGPNDWGVLSEKARDNQIRLMIVALPVNPGKGKRADMHLWPKGTFIQMTCKGVSKPIRIDMQRKQQSHDETEWKGLCKMLDLTDKITDPGTPFQIEVLCLDNNPYIFVVGLFRHRSPDAIFSDLTSPNSGRILSREEATKKAMSFIKGVVVLGDSDTEDGTNKDSGKETIGKTIFSLKDSFTKQLIGTPARGKDCVHPQCFDLKPFLVGNAFLSGQRWRCRVCEKFVSHEDIEICGLTSALVNEFGEKAITANRDRVEFRSDETYALLDERRKRYGGKSGPKSEATSSRSGDKRSTTKNVEIIEIL